MTSPIFLFSLPRTGSTLLQKVLMSHKDIASVAEPWLLLPFCYAYKKTGIFSEYSHQHSFNATEDFINNLPNKEHDYYNDLSIFINSLYEKQCLKGEKYFLDKTPRYYNIIPEIHKIFPNAKFVFLFRNPVNILASMITTWTKNNRLKILHAIHNDLYYGLKALSYGYELLKEKSYSLKYEDFVSNPQKYTKEICEYLNVDYDKTMITKFRNQDTKGRSGDPTGVKSYKKITDESKKKWKTVFHTNFRKKILFNYINNIDDKTFHVQQYNKKIILNEIKRLETSGSFCVQDIFDYTYSQLLRYLKLNIIFNKPLGKDKFLS